MPIQFPGVLVKPSRFQDSLRLPCGYLHIPSTGHLRKWLEEPQVTTIISPFLVENEQCFGLTGLKCKIQKIVSIKIIMIMYMNPTMASVLACGSLAEIPNSIDQPIHCHIHTIYLMIRMFP